MAVIAFILFSLLLSVTDSDAASGTALTVCLRSEHGAVVPNAQVRIEPLSLAAYCNREGCCSFYELDPGNYLVQAEAEGYAQADTIVRVTDGERVELELLILPVSYEMSEVLVETKRQQRVLEFSREDIVSSGSASLESFLSSKAGLDIQSDGGSGGETTARIGGSNANQVIVLMDGRRIQSPGSGAADLSAIPLNWIETVDVHRGSSTLLGGEAIGGVVNIHTRKLSDQVETFAAVDVNAHRQVSTVSHSGSIGELQSFISFTRTQGNGKYSYRISEDDGNEQFTNQLGSSIQRLNNDIVQDQLFAKTVYQMSRRSSLELSGASDRMDRGIPGYISPRLTPLARQSSGSHFLNTLFRSKIAKTEWQSAVSFTRSYRHFSDPGPYSLVHEVRETDSRMSGSIEGKREIFSIGWSGGAQFGSEAFSSSQLMSDQVDRKRWEGWLRAERRALGIDNSDNLVARVGWRAERVGDSEIMGLPKIEAEATTKRIVEGSLSLGWGRSYRAPSFYSLFWQEDQVARGNPDLIPEYSEEWTSSFSISPKFMKAAKLSGTASLQTVDDLIYWQQTFDGHWKPMNLKQADIQTLDVQLAYRLLADHLHLAAATTWTEARDATDDRNTGGKYLTFRPPRTHRINLDLYWQELHAAAAYRWTDARPVLATNSKWLSEYELLDIYMTRTFDYAGFKVQPGLRITNALNESYRIIRHAPMPLREISASIQLTRTTQ